MATLHLSLNARLDGCQPAEKNKSLIRGSSNPIFQKQSCLLMHKDASPRHAWQVVAHAMAGIAPETKKTQGAGEPLSRVARKQLKWEKMMKAIEDSGSAVDVLSNRKEDEKISKSDVLGTLIRLRQLNKWTMVLEVLIWLKEQDWWNFGIQDFNLIIAAYGKLGQPGNAESSFTEMREAGLEPNVACFTSLLEAHARADNFERAESIYREMVETGPAPTEVTYQVYINALCKAERFDDAERIFNSMGVKDEAKPDARLYNLMIHTYGKARKFSEQQSLFRRMKGSGVPMTAVTFNSLMAFQKTVEDAEACLRHMQAAKIKPDVITYTGLINAYSKARRVEEAQAVFREMVASGIKPSRTAYNTLLDAYARCKEVEGAESLFKKMGQDRCRPDVHSYTTLLAAYANSGNMKKAEQLLKRMKQAGLEPNVVTYGTLMLGYTSVHDTTALLRTFEELKKAGIKPNATIFTLLIRTSGQQEKFSDALSWFKMMVESGCAADQRSRAALMDACQTSEQKEEVLDYFGTLN
ncbi:hypothetical protein M758_1G061500 [Ceratodon purpureus]|nr:hypothetical protein M758_1G061500 [Ceratodon purpureus]